MLFFFSNLNPIINERLAEYSIFSLNFAVNLKGFSLVKRTWGSLFNLFVLFCFFRGWVGMVGGGGASANTRDYSKHLSLQSVLLFMAIYFG